MNQLPNLHGQSHFTTLQPVLSTNFSAHQIKSLLCLSILFWQRPTFTDTQLGDNPHLYKEFLNPDSELLSPLIGSMLASGEARMLLRKHFLYDQKEHLHECKSLLDVYEGWKKQNMPGAWVVPPDSLNRERFVSLWDDRVPSRSILNYDYLDVKKQFQGLVISKVSENSFGDILESDIYEEIRSISKRSWFSHSDIYNLLQNKNIAKSEAARVFGLLDEAAYSVSLNSGMAALNVPNAAVFSHNKEVDGIIEHVCRIMTESFKRVEISDLRLLGLLSFDELMSIREKGSFLIDAINTMRDSPNLEDRHLKEVSLALSSYWNIICNELDNLHPGASRAKTRLGLTVSSQTVLPVDEIIDGVAIVLSGLASMFTGGPEGQSSTVRKVVDRLSFKFLLMGETREMKNLRTVLSKNAVLSTAGKLT